MQHLFAITSRGGEPHFSLIEDVPGLITLDRKNPSFVLEKGLVPVDQELQNSGPSEYNLGSDVYTWIHGQQKGDGSISGNDIYLSLKNEGESGLGSCLRISDAHEIVSRGSEYFLKFFNQNVLLFFASVFQVGKERYVPILLQHEGSLSNVLVPLSTSFKFNHLIPRFVKEKL